MSFINENFMLKNECAKRLYSAVRGLPIIDYHCHLSPREIAEDKKFRNVTELFLGGDHYKWRQLRTAGIDEELITGAASDYDKFMAFAGAMPYLIGNPIYHWTHLELKRYFDIDETLDEHSAQQIWNRCNELLATPEFSAKSLIKRSRVEALCTTDDPLDTLEYHEALRDFEVKVLPTFRPDKLLDIEKDSFFDYLKAANITDYKSLEKFIAERVEYFAKHGCKLSDHSFGAPVFALGDAAAVLEKRLAGEKLSDNEAAIYRTEVFTLLAEQYHKHGFAVQIHIGALRNNNRTMFEKIGADAGFDSIDDKAVAEPLSKLLSHLEYRGILGKTILYNLNPKDNYTLATMIGNFQCAPTPSKMQFGSGWWFCDQRDGMENQLRALANLGTLSYFVGMLTDSRSFVSYTRHEYFRRILCNLIGQLVTDGEYPENYEYLERIVRNICYFNAKSYFN
ncbi:MAG: glucuronate isomerase, partial [Clostridia bacterium]|nr:glucuronate isomerase [Clostridia bacterium]